MKKALKILIGVSVVLTLCGCGKTNLLQWAAPVPKPDNTEAARQAIDEGKYEKAYNLVKDDDSDDGKIIRAQALLGKSDIDLAAIIVALGKDAVDLGGGTKSDSPLLKLESLIDDAGYRENVLAAANLYLAANVNKTSDKVIGALTGLLAHVANLRNAADQDFKAYITGKNDSDECVSFYNALGSEKLGYITMASNFLSGGNEEIKSAIVSANAVIKSIDATVKLTDAVRNNSPTAADCTELAKEFLNKIDPWIFAEFGTEYNGLSLNDLENKVDNSLNDEVKNYLEAELPNTVAPWSAVKVLFGL
ncbi:MAG: hypothetical protein LBL50_02085 [Candidatus Margulisbacteria bacterium]|jgi:hypothetical protein|nr:hypothetical protein [Candidatus Margulisiibacteriota bacterium]